MTYNQCKDRRLVIFGIDDMAARMHHYFQQCSIYKIAGFTVDAAFKTSDNLLGHPVTSFEDLPHVCSPEDHDIFIAVGYSDQNKNRERITLACEALGYRLASFIAPSAAIHTEDVGVGCTVLDNATIGPFCSLGKGVVIGPNSVVSHHSHIGDFVYLGPSVTVPGSCKVGQRVFLGVGSVLRDGISVADGTSIGMNAAVTKPIERPGLYAGNPAKLLRPF